jgi:hypothetical protein
MLSNRSLHTSKPSSSISHDPPASSSICLDEDEHPPRVICRHEPSRDLFLSPALPGKVYTSIGCFIYSGLLWVTLGYSE